MKSLNRQIGRDFDPAPKSSDYRLTLSSNHQMAPRFALCGPVSDSSDNHPAIPAIHPTQAANLPIIDRGRPENDRCENDRQSTDEFPRSTDPAISRLSRIFRWVNSLMIKNGKGVRS
jgi:hypothetical protein